MDDFTASIGLTKTPWNRPKMCDTRYSKSVEDAEVALFRWSARPLVIQYCHLPWE